jgi:hypothetical protein
MEQLYRSPNGDTWFLARDPMTGSAFVRHRANASSGGQVTDVEIDEFLRVCPEITESAFERVKYGFTTL